MVLYVSLYLKYFRYLQNMQYQIEYSPTSTHYNTAWKVSKYGVFSGLYFPVFSPNTGKYGQEKTPYLGTFSAMHVPANGKKSVAGPSRSLESHNSSKLSQVNFNWFQSKDAFDFNLWLTVKTHRSWHFNTPSQNQPS